MKRKRVLYLTHYAELYGANRSLLDLIMTLRDQGYIEPVVVLAADGPFRSILQKHDIAQVVIPFQTWMHKRVFSGGPHHRLLQRMRFRRAARERDRSAKQAAEAIEAFARKRRIELVHTNSSVIGIGGGVARALGVPHVWHIRELPFLHYGFSVDGGMRRYAQELRQAQGIIALSQAVVSDMRTLLPSETPVHVIPNGICSENALPVQRVGATTAGFNFLLAALFHPAKGQELAVRAFAKVHGEEKNTTLHLVGGGRDDAVRKLVNELGLQQAVIFHGFVDDISGLLVSADGVLQCSKHEALGRIVLEAMAAGIPVIGHASGATPELVEHGVTGLLFTSQDELATHMLTLVRDRERGIAMGEAARARIPAEFTLEVMADRTWKVYQGLMHVEK